MSEENVEVVRKMLEAWNRRDDETARRAFDPDVELEMSIESDMDGSYRGYEGLQKMVRFWGAFTDFRSEPRGFLDSGDEVVTNLHHSGRGKASGVEVQMDNWQVFTVRNGRIGRWRVYGTRRQALEAAGLSEDDAQ